MRMPKLLLLGLLLPLPACSFQPRQQTIPDQSVPHRLAADVQADIWVDLGNGHYGQQRVTLPAGWWVAAPAVVEQPASP